MGRIGLRLGGFRLGSGLGYELRARPLVGHLLRVDALDVDMVVVDPERPDGTRSDHADRDQLEGPLRHPGPAEHGADEAHGLSPGPTGGSHGLGLDASLLQMISYHGQP